MQFEEISKLLDFSESQSKLFVPNEIFTDIQNIHKLNNYKETVSNYISFTYSYYYLILWLWRYAKYGYVQVNVQMIKTILGYNPEYRESNFIIKKNGLLEKMNYIKTVKDFPINSQYDDTENELQFTMFSDLDTDSQKYIKEQYGNNYTVKMPVHGYYRYPNEEELQHDYNNGYEDGVFRFIDNTHMIPFEVFMYCMDNEKICCIGFYLYCYFKMKNDLYKSGYDVSLENLESETGIKSATLDRYLDILKKYRMIDCIHNQEYFCLALSEKERMANTYITNDFELFSDKPITYKKIEVKTVKEHIASTKQTWGSKEVIDITLDQLPY